MSIPFLARRAPRGRRLALVAAGAGLASLVAIPTTASADTLEAYNNGLLQDSVAINSIWVLVAALLVIFMQAGFAFLEIGFSRGKNAGTVVAKILMNFSIAAIGYWACRIRVRLRHGRDHRHRAGISCATSVIRWPRSP